jgi:BirA family transcriptional regulator, biotin operon repressor / biotin---[acetyl-CoA-carboxylase] ligase
LYKIPAKTLFVGKNLVFLPECHSTNSYLLDLARASQLPEGTLVITDNQTAGRGQRNHQWHTEEGQNLTFSLLLAPKFLSVKNQFLLSQAIALAVHDSIKLLINAEVKVKWPNDIMIDGKKTCGILIENQLTGNAYEAAVVGIGLNVNQTNFSLSTATSLALAAGETFDLDELLDSLCKHVEVRYLQLKNNQAEQLKSDYLDAMYWRGEAHHFFGHGKNFAGMIAGVDETGKLKVESEGKQHIFDLKEIAYLA